MSEKPIKRMTLRQLLTHAEKASRDLIDLVQTRLLSRVSDFRDLSRPIRRRSHYPTLLAVQNALRKVQETGQEVNLQATDLHEALEAIREHADRERINRI